MRDAVDHVAALHGVLDLVGAGCIGEKVDDVEFAEHRLGLVAVRTLRVARQERFHRRMRLAVLLVATQVTDLVVLVGRRVGRWLAGGCAGFVRFFLVLLAGLLD